MACDYICYHTDIAIYFIEGYSLDNIYIIMLFDKWHTDTFIARPRTRLYTFFLFS